MYNFYTWLTALYHTKSAISLFLRLIYAHTVGNYNLFHIFIDFHLTFCIHEIIRHIFIILRWLYQHPLHSKMISLLRYGLDINLAQELRH